MRAAALVLLVITMASAVPRKQYRSLQQPSAEAFQLVPAKATCFMRELQSNYAFLEMEAKLQKKKEIEIPQQKDFRVRCRCGKPVIPFSHLLLPFDIQFGKCAASKVRIEQTNPGWIMKNGRFGPFKENWGMNSDQINKAIGNPLNQKWAKADIQHISDFQGRTEAQIIGFPGGDLAQFVLALNVYMGIIDASLEESECVDLLRQYLKKSKKASFYYPSDFDVVALISQDLDTATIDLTQPPSKDFRPRILNMLSTPLYQGSAILRIMLQRPEAFRLRSAKTMSLTACAIRAFFTVLWDKDDPASKKTRLVELEGKSNEKAIVRVYSSLPCEAQGIVPLIAPSSKTVCDDNGCNKQMFLVNPQAPKIMHEDMCDFFAVQNGKVDANRMRKDMRDDAKRLEYIALDSVRTPSEDIQMPQYDVYLE